MNKLVKNRLAALRKECDNYKDGPDWFAIQLRRDFAKIATGRLVEKGWSDEYLAELCRMRPKTMAAILDGSKDFNFATAGKIAHALGIRIKLIY